MLAYARDKLMKLALMSAPGIVVAYGRTDETGRRYRDACSRRTAGTACGATADDHVLLLTAPDGTEVYPTHDNGEARLARAQAGLTSSGDRYPGLEGTSEPPGHAGLGNLYTRAFRPPG